MTPIRFFKLLESPDTLYAEDGRYLAKYQGYGVSAIIAKDYSYAITSVFIDGGHDYVRSAIRSGGVPEKYAPAVKIVQADGSPGTPEQWAELKAELGEAKWGYVGGYGCRVWPDHNVISFWGTRADQLPQVLPILQALLHFLQQEGTIADASAVKVEFGTSDKKFAIADLVAGNIDAKDGDDEDDYEDHYDEEAEEEAYQAQLAADAEDRRKAEEMAALHTAVPGTAARNGRSKLGAGSVKQGGIAKQAGFNSPASRTASRTTSESR